MLFAILKTGTKKRDKVEQKIIFVIFFYTISL